MTYIDEVWVLLVLWAALVALGLLVSLYAYRAWRSSRERALGLLATGFIALSLAAALSWFTLWEMGVDPILCEAGATSFSVFGFGTILYALRTRAP